MVTLEGGSSWHTCGDFGGRILLVKWRLWRKDPHSDFGERILAATLEGASILSVDEYPRKGSLLLVPS